VQLPADTMRAAIPRLTGSLSVENAKLIPRAIMTTDTFPKECAASFTTSRGEFHIAGTAKGAGMIAPNMATLLAFMITDAPIAKPDLDAIFRRCIDKSLNAITIDGDMSTNDSAFLLSPASDSPLSDTEDLREFEAALLYVTEKLGELIVTDAEGATKLARITVTGAASEEDAKRAARAIAESMLVKTAMFGRDPNWGRIACAAGYSGADISEKKLTIRIDDETLFADGAPAAKNEANLMEILGRRSYTIHVDLGLGNGTSTYLTSDLSYDYVKINAEYST
nr:bifunctional ornithine acetyltransferase/N-acetylglutamate synthase [Spirochaetota bacterium]